MPPCPATTLPELEDGGITQPRPSPAAQCDGGEEDPLTRREGGGRKENGERYNTYLTLERRNSSSDDGPPPAAAPHPRLLPLRLRWAHRSSPEPGSGEVVVRVVSRSGGEGAGDSNYLTKWGSQAGRRLLYPTRGAAR